MDQIAVAPSNGRLAEEYQEQADGREPGRWAMEPPSSCLSDDEWRSIQKALGLSRRQLQIVLHIFDGLHEDAIGCRLGISCHTVHAHLNRLYNKLKVTSRSALIVRLFVAYVSDVSGNKMPVG